MAADDHLDQGRLGNVARPYGQGGGGLPQVLAEGLLDAAAELGIGVIGFTALTPGLLTNRYLDGIPEDSRAAQKAKPSTATGCALNDLASHRGQTLAQLALTWALRDERVTSLVIGASSVEQLEQNVDALDNLELSEEELAEIDRQLASEDERIDMWAEARRGGL